MADIINNILILDYSILYSYILNRVFTETELYYIGYSIKNDVFITIIYAYHNKSYIAICRKFFSI